MASRLNPYVNFDGQAREALELYQRVFGGELNVMTFGEMGMDGTPFADKVMHGQLETPQGFTLMCSDLPPGMEHRPGTNLSISLSGMEDEDGADLRSWFAQLSEGGEVATPLEVQMWGDEFGQCTDRFGIGWLVNIGKQQG